MIIEHKVHSVHLTFLKPRVIIRKLYYMHSFPWKEESQFHKTN